MQKSLLKLIAVGLLVVIALVVAIAASYAWFSVSNTPSAVGLQLNIGTSNTIKIAADIAVQTAEGVVHYPGTFTESLDFSKNSAYDYLQNLETLTPVSTADGIHWYFPTYYESEEGENAGLQGSIRDAADFLLDETLTYANLSALPLEEAVQGTYAMLDFWVVSPTQCQLRISAGKGNNGSYLVSIPRPVSDGAGSYTLQQPDEIVAACARVGFLANTQAVRDLSMNHYVDSVGYDANFRSLRGVYQEAGESWSGYPAQFTIYEPNGNHHNDGFAYQMTETGLGLISCVDGSYIRTMPIGYVDGSAQMVDVTAQTTVQTATTWLKASDDERLIQQIFQAYLAGESEKNADTLYRKFYQQYLGYQCGAYLQKGTFIKRSEKLADAYDADGVIPAEVLDRLNTATVTNDVTIVELEKNVPQRIRMFVWIEGQDVDCSGGFSDAGLLLNLELAGGND